MKLHALILIPVLLLSAASPWVMRAYGPDFSPGAPVMVIHLGTAFLLAVHSPVWPVLLAAGKLRPVILLNVGWAGVFVVLAFFGVRWGALGLATARFVAYFCYTIAMFGLTHRLITRELRSPSIRPLL